MLGCRSLSDFLVCSESVGVVLFETSWLVRWKKVGGQAARSGARSSTKEADGLDDDVDLDALLSFLLEDVVESVLVLSGTTHVELRREPEEGRAVSWVDMEREGAELLATSRECRRISNVMERRVRVCIGGSSTRRKAAYGRVEEGSADVPEVIALQDELM